MKKGIVFLSLAMVALGIQAEKTTRAAGISQEKIAQYAREKSARFDDSDLATMVKDENESSVIRYTVTIYRDTQECDIHQWKKTKKRAQDTLSRLKNAEKKDSDWIDQFTTGLNETLKEAYTFGGVETGVHGEVQIKIGDGTRRGHCACGDACECATRYAGNCPCSLDSMTRSGKNSATLRCQDLCD